MGGGCPQTPLVGMHTYMCVNVLLHATIILLPSYFPPQLKILYEILAIIPAKRQQKIKLYLQLESMHLKCVEFLCSLIYTHMHYSFMHNLNFGGYTVESGY